MKNLFIAALFALCIFVSAPAQAANWSNGTFSCTVNIEAQTLGISPGSGGVGISIPDNLQKAVTPPLWNTCPDRTGSTPGGRHSGPSLEPLLPEKPRHLW